MEVSEREVDNGPWELRGGILLKQTIHIHHLECQMFYSVSVNETNGPCLQSPTSIHENQCCLDAFDSNFVISKE